MLDRLVTIGIPCFTVLGFASLLALVSRVKTGLRISPVTAFLASWVPMALILAGRWVAFYPLEEWFLYLVGSSIASFFLGSCLFAREETAEATLLSVREDRFNALLRGTFAVAALGFLVFVVAGVVQVGWRGFFLHPEILRSAMGQGTFSDPSKLLNYANILFPVLVVIGHESLGGISRRWWVPAILCALSNLFSTGRTKIVWVLIWSASVVLLSREKSGLRKSLLVGGSALLLSLLVFGGMAIWLGKYFSPVDIQRFAPEIPERMGWAMNVLFYIGAGLPYFQETLGQPESLALPLPNILLPYYKLFGLGIPEMPLGSEILPMLPTPIPANAGTWLVQFSMDLGIPGIILGPFLIGGIASWILTRPQWALNHPMRLYFGGLLLSVIWMGFMANKLVSTPTWIFFLLGYPAMNWITSPPSQFQKPV